MDPIEKTVYRIMTGDLSDELAKTFSKLGVRIKITDWKRYGPYDVYEVKFKGNTREAHVRARAPDVQFRLQVKQLFLKKFEQRLFIFITDEDIEYDHLPLILTDEELRQMQLPYPVGFGIINEPYLIDLAQGPHLLMGGSSGSGKSVGLQTVIASVAYTKTPAEANLVLIDTGASDLMYFEELPHLSCPIIQNREAASQALNAVAAEMTRRIRLEHTEPNKYALLPRLVVVVDEFPALFSGANKEERRTLTDTINALLQRGRHAKIHLVLAAQNPTAHQMKVEVGNITTRIAFRCAKKNFSEVILGEAGAENLAGKGELLLKAPKFDDTERLQGVYATPDELRQLVYQIRQRYHGTDKDWRKFTIPTEVFQTSNAGGSLNADALSVPVKAKSSVEDQTFAKVLLWALSQDTISVNALTEEYHMGWSKANKLVRRLEELGVVGALDGKLPRCVVPTEIGDLSAEMLEFLQRNGISVDTVSHTIETRN